MPTVGRVAGLIIVVAVLGCSTGPRPELFDGTWQASGASNDVFEVVESGENLAGKIVYAGDSVGVVGGTNLDGQVQLYLIVNQFTTPDGVINDYGFSITGHFVNVNTIVGAESDSPGSTVTLTRQP
jgi:hypothetical protein